MLASQRSKTGRAGALLAGAAAAFAIYALSHPRPAEHGSDLTASIASMAAQSQRWILSHSLGLVALALIATAMWLLLRSSFLGRGSKERPWAWVVLAGAVIGVVEHVPHLLAASEAAQLPIGGATPFTDIHMVLQALFTPVYGIGIAGLALAGFGRIAHPIACVLGIFGGVALIAVAPLLLVTGNGTFAMLFLPANGTWIFLIAAGIRIARTSAGDSRTTSTVPASW